MMRMHTRRVTPPIVSTKFREGGLGFLYAVVVTEPLSGTRIAWLNVGKVFDFTVVLLRAVVSIQLKRHVPPRIELGDCAQRAIRDRQGLSSCSLFSFISFSLPFFGSSLGGR